MGRKQGSAAACYGTNAKTLHSYLPVCQMGAGLLDDSLSQPVIG